MLCGIVIVVRTIPTATAVEFHTAKVTVFTCSRRVGNFTLMGEIKLALRFTLVRGVDPAALRSITDGRGLLKSSALLVF